MKLLLKQRFFSWFDSYDVYYEDGSVAFKVKGEPAWGHLLRLFEFAPLSLFLHKKFEHDIL